MFKMQQRYLADPPKNGQLVVCRGRLSVYEARGDYQLIVDIIESHGEGALQIAFEQLKKRLAAEGLFDNQRKKHLPFIPKHITLITSPQGAAVHDFLRVARKRFPLTNISVFPVAVQGYGAADEIVAAIEEINRSISTDVIVLCRGGGSIEDLWSFNEEKVARAISASEIVIVSGIGHEIDYTIADFVADLRAPTPSAAAELVLPDSTSLTSKIEQLEKRISHLIISILEKRANRLALCNKILGNSFQQLDNLFLRLDHLSMRLEGALINNLSRKQTKLGSLNARIQQKKPSLNLALKKEQIIFLERRLIIAGKKLLESRKNRLSAVAGLLDAVSPLGTLARGYSITRKEPEQKIITDSTQVKPGDNLFILLNKGGIRCNVKETKSMELKK